MLHHAALCRVVHAALRTLRCAQLRRATHNNKRCCSAALAHNTHAPCCTAPSAPPARSCPASSCPARCASLPAARSPRQLCAFFSGPSPHRAAWVLSSCAYRVAICSFSTSMPWRPVTYLIRVVARRDVPANAADVLDHARRPSPKLAPAAISGTLNFRLVRQLGALVKYCHLFPLDSIAFGPWAACRCGLLAAAMELAYRGATSAYSRAMSSQRPRLEYLKRRNRFRNKHSGRRGSPAGLRTSPN